MASNIEINDVHMDTTASAPIPVEAESGAVSEFVAAFKDVRTCVEEAKESIKRINGYVFGLEKRVNRLLRAQQKDQAKRKQRIINRKPSGFAKPSRISPELAAFMQKEAGAEIARTEVTQFIINYIREHNLQNAENRKVIQPDAALTELLAVKEGDQLTYFNLQKYMNRHFVKKTVEAFVSA